MNTIPSYNSNLAVGTLAEIAVPSLHPAQLSLGYREVEYRIQQFKSMNGEQLDAYLQEYFLPIVIAPSKLPYVVDHHHRARAIQMTGLRDTVYVKILENCKDWTQDKFWQLMKENGWVYLYDKDGNPADVNAIPPKLDDLPDDKYRSLAWAVLKAGGYQKCQIPFQEFLWGNYFRRNLSFEDTEFGFTDAVNQALFLCRSPQASKLPGYIHS